MKKRLIIQTFLATLLLFSIAFVSADPVFCSSWEGNGAGTEGDPYQIEKIEHLVGLHGCWLENSEGVYFELMNNLDFQNDDDYLFSANKSLYAYPSGSFHPIGSDHFPPYEYGVQWYFDGKGFNISNLYIKEQTQGYCSGFYSYLVSGYWIKNTNFLDVNVNLFGVILNCGGAIVGNNHGLLDNIHTTGIVIGGEEAVGGLVGRYGIIQNSSFDGEVWGGEGWAGGLVGIGEYIINSYSRGLVQSNQYTGGLAGNVVSIINSYSNANVISENYAGGIVGEGTATITNTYATGVLSGMETRGIVGGGTATIIDSFYDNETTGQSLNFIIGSGTPKTTAEMQTLSTFSGWDIVLWKDWDGETWFIDEGNDYPRLFFEYTEPPEEPEEPDEQPSYTSSSIYQTLESTGAGLGMFMTYVARGLPLLMISLLIVGIVLAIAFPIASIIRNSIQSHQK